jgi:hypothetical protein
MCHEVALVNSEADSEKLDLLRLREVVIAA